MTKKFLLNTFMKKTIHAFTLTLAISAFSCDAPENNTNNQENKEIPAITQNSENSDNTTENTPPDNTDININNEKQNTKDSDSNTQNVTPNNPDINTDKKEQKPENPDDNTEKTSPDTPEINNNQEKHIVIYGIGIRGKKINEDNSISPDTNNKFAIIYNQTENEIDISEWKIKKAKFETKDDSDFYRTTFNIPKETVIKSKQYLLLTRSNYDETSWSADVNSDIFIEGKLDFATTGNHIVLIDTNDNIIDSLDYIELSKSKQKTWERKYNEVYITENSNTAYIFRVNPDVDTDKNHEDFISLTINDECILKNSQTIAE